MILPRLLLPAIALFLLLLPAPILSHSVPQASFGQSSQGQAPDGAGQGQVDRLNEIRQKIQETESLLDQTRSKKATLQNEIAYQDNQIRLTTLKIEETEAEVVALTGQIDKLEGVLGGLSLVFAERAEQTYKITRLGDPLVLLLTADDLGQFIQKFHYLQRVQENDRVLLLQMQTTQTAYEDQRAKVQALQDRLEAQKNQLALQKTQKQQLLDVTRNDEKRFQELLEALRADEAAIQRALSSLVAQIAAGIATGSPVSKGQIIGGQGNTGHVFPKPSSSCPTCGSHLHFMILTCDITKNGLDCHTNPRPYIYDGQYNKPMDTWREPPNQEYGQATCTICGYAFHTGIDISSFHGAPIYVVESGTVYYGVDGAGGKYALVKHRDDFWSAYWHLQ